MKKLWTLAGLISCLMVGASCVEETGQLLVLRNDLRSTGQCNPTPTQEGAGLSRGTLDIMLSNRYVMFPVVLNTMKPSSNVTVGVAGGGAGGGAGGAGGAGGGTGGIANVQTEGNIVNLESATVSIIAPETIQFPVPQGVEIPTSGAVFPEDVISTGLEVISPVLGDAIRASSDFYTGTAFKRGTVITVLVEVKFKGTSSSGTEVESNEFTFPLDICAGCLLTYAPDTVVPAVADGNGDDDRLTCDPIDRAAYEDARNEEGEGTGAIDDVTTNIIMQPCFVGQDEAVDCRLCRTLAVASSDPDAICDPPQ
jgi:hypothetical protein